MTERGLTLVEVMVSVAVTGFIALAIWSAASQTSRARDIVSFSQEQFHQVRLAFELLNRDLRSTFLSLHRGGEPTHDTIFIGEDGGDADSLHFAAFSHVRRFFDADESDQAEISYFVEEDPEMSGVRNLVRRESPILDRHPKEGGRTTVIVRDIAAFDLEYYDIVAKQWQRTWDTTQLTGDGTVLPTQVRIRLVVNERVGAVRGNWADAQAVPVAYGTQIPVPMRTPILVGPWFTPGLPLGAD